MFINRIFHVKMLLKDGAEYIQKESAQKSNNTQQLHIECGCYILTQWTKQQATGEKNTRRRTEKMRKTKPIQSKAEKKQRRQKIEMKNQRRRSRSTLNVDKICKSQLCSLKVSI